MDRRTDRLTDRWNRQTEGPMEESDFIGHCPTNVECPIYK